MFRAGVRDSGSGTRGPGSGVRGPEKKNGEVIATSPFVVLLQPKAEPRIPDPDYCSCLCSTSCTGSFFFPPSPLIWIVGSGAASFSTCWR